MAVTRHGQARLLSLASGGLTLLLGSMITAGWALNVEWMRALVPGQIVSLPNTAFGFMASGAASLLLQDGAPDARRRAGRVLSVLVLVLGVLTFAERVGGYDFGIDRLLFADAVSRYPYRPLGRMATNSALSFICAGVALTALVGRRWRRVSRVSAVIGLFISTLALVGYLYGARQLYTFDAAAGMALVTAIAFEGVFVSILFARATDGSIGLLTGSTMGSVLARQLLPWVIGVPLALGRLWIAARDAGLVSREGAGALFTLCTMALLAGIVLHSARGLSRADTDRTLALQREAAARERAEEANEAKSRFLATMSHELRTPLNAIGGYAQLMALSLRGPVTLEQGHDLHRIEESTKYLTAVISDILAFAKAGSGEFRIELSVVSLREIYDDVRQVLGADAAHRGVTLDIGPDETLMVMGDRDRVRQILLNLVSNGLKFTGAGGRVAISALAIGARVHIEVSDTGIGIDAGQFDAVFEPFIQIRKQLVEPAHGVGLGLPISRDLARRMDGDVVVASTLGVGSRFTLILPLGEQTALSAPAQDTA